MRFLRTVSTGRLAAVIVVVVLAVAGGTAIAVAATGSGPVPRRQPLAHAVHQALTAPSVTGITADISFTDNLIDSSDFTGRSSDPVLQGATGRLWLTDAGRLRIELQSSNGDAQVVVNQRRFWISDPSRNVVLEGTLPAPLMDRGSGHDGPPSVAQIQSEIERLMGRVDLSGAQPTDVAGRAAYRVVVSPKHDGGLLGSAQLAWDAARGVPLQFGIYARGNSTPVLSLKATHVSYGRVSSSDLDVAPPAGARVIHLASESTPRAARKGGQAKVHGVRAVAAHVPFKLNAPTTLVGLPRHMVKLFDLGGRRAVAVLYGENLGGMAVIESKASAGASGAGTSPANPLDGLHLPTVSINGSTGQELSTPLGTVVDFTRGGVDYTVIGSVPATAAELAARAL